MAFGKTDSKHMTAEDFTEPTVITIREFKQEVLGIGDKQDTKWVMYMNNRSGKGLALNKTAEKMLLKLFGTPAGENPGALNQLYAGKQIELYIIDTDYQGEPCKGIRLRAAPNAPQQQAPQAEEPPPPSGEFAGEAPQPMGTGDDIPF